MNGNCALTSRPSQALVSHIGIELQLPSSANVGAAFRAVRVKVLNVIFPGYAGEELEMEAAAGARLGRRKANFQAIVGGGRSKQTSVVSTQTGRQLY